MRFSSAHARRRLLVVAVLTTVAMVVGACGSGSSPESSPSNMVDPEHTSGDVDTSDVRLQVGVSAQAAGLRATLAEASGAFEGTEYEIEWSEWETTTSSLEALSAGAIDIALAQQTAGLVLRQGNATEEWTAETMPFVVVSAEIGPADPGFQLLVAPGSEFESITDLKGERIAFSPGSQGHYYLIRVIDEAGLTPEDFDLIELNPSEGRAAFIGGSVSAMIAGYRNAQRLFNDDAARSIGSSGDLFDALQLAVVRQGVLDDPAKAAAIADLLTRVQDNHRWHSENIPAVAQMHEDLRQLGEDEALASAATEWNQRVPIDDEVIAALQRQADVFHDVGVIPTRIDVAIIFDRRFNNDVIAGGVLGAGDNDQAEDQDQDEGR